MKLLLCGLCLLVVCCAGCAQRSADRFGIPGGFLLHLSERKRLLRHITMCERLWFRPPSACQQTRPGCLAPARPCTTALTSNLFMQFWLRRPAQCQQLVVSVLCESKLSE